MKINSCFIISFCLALLGCEGETEAPIQSVAIPVTISPFVLPMAGATRADLNEHEDFVDGDEIAMHVYSSSPNKYHTFRYDGSNWNGTATYPTDKDYILYWAFYPANAFMDGYDSMPSQFADDDYFEVKADQSTNENYRASDLLKDHGGRKVVPKNASEQDISLSFIHAMAKIEVNVYSDENELYIKKVTLLNVDRCITYNDLDNLSDREIAHRGRSTGEVIVCTSPSSTGSTSLHGAALIPGQAIKKGTPFIRVDTNLGLAEYTLEGGDNFYCSEWRNFDIRVSKPDIGITTSINAWTDRSQLNVKPLTDYGIPLTIEAKVAGAKVTIANPLKRTISYITSIKGVSNGAKSAATSFYVTLTNVGDRIMLFGNADTYTTYASSKFTSTTVTLSKDCYVYGNMMSLIDAANYPTLRKLSAPYTFRSFFSKCGAYLENHPEKKLLLPAETLTEECYANMFDGCSYLERAPELPALTLANKCYYQMFANCSNLRYLKAMFTQTATDATTQWLQSAGSSGGYLIFVKNRAATWTNTGDSGVPEGWTVLYADF